MKKKTRRRLLSAGLCLALMASYLPAGAATPAQAIPPVIETAIPIEKPAYSFLIRYDTAASKAALLAKIMQLGGEVESEIDFMRCVSATIDMDQLAIIKEMVCVQQVEKNYDYNLLATEMPVISDERRRELADLSAIPEKDEEAAADVSSAGLSETQVQQQILPAAAAVRLVHEQGVRGQGIKIALFDTGVSSHPDLQVAGGVSFIENSPYSIDSDGHGTRMAGIIAACGAGDAGIKGVAPEAQLYAVKVVGNSGFITTAAILQGIGWAINNGMDLINMSFGNYYASPLLQEAIDKAHGCGILMVAAVGNDGGFEDEYRVMYPAAYEHVVAAGAGSAGGTERFSNSSEKLDFVAPGRLDTTDIAESYTHVTGTSVSAAYVTGQLAGIWSGDSGMSSREALTLAKNTAAVSANQQSYAGYGQIQMEKALEKYGSCAILETDVEKTMRNSVTALQRLAARKAAALEDVSDNMPAAMAAGNCFSNEMASAKLIPFLNWQSGHINCPGDEVWYKFTTASENIHPNGGPGRYLISTNSTYTNFDTQLYLYDSSGNQIAFNDDVQGRVQSYISIQLPYNRTYYIRLKGYGDATGSYHIRVGYFSDDHGDTFGSATAVYGVYNDASVAGHLDTGDVDYFLFAPGKNCVMEFSSVGTVPNTRAIVYDECSNAVAVSRSNGNGNFVVSCSLEATKSYYIFVTGYNTNDYGDYTLRFKFIKDYSNDIVNEQYQVVYWHNQDDLPLDNGDLLVVDKAFISNAAKSEYLTRVLLSQDKNTLYTKIEEGGTALISFLFSTFASSICQTNAGGLAVSTAMAVGETLYNLICPSDQDRYMDMFYETDGTNRYIIAEYIPGYIYYRVGSGTYYGETYLRGQFIDTILLTTVNS